MVLKVTLPASIIVSFSGRTLEVSMLIVILFGFLFDVLLMAVGYVMYRKNSLDQKGFAVVNTTGCNIGSFVMPFVQSFLSPLSVMTISLFDIGNGVICLGGSYSVADMIRKGTKKSPLLMIGKAMVKSVSLMTYVVMTILCLFQIPLPGPITELASIVGAANPFLAMFMIGIGFELHLDRNQKHSVYRILIPRYIIGITLSVLFYNLLPAPLAIRQALAIVCLSPISNAAPAFTAELDGDYSLASSINSISIIIGIISIYTALALIG